MPRTKTNEQMLAEFDALHSLGWCGSLFLVDDNFIGNKRETMRLLPALAAWQQDHGYPFDLYTEASVNLGRNEPLMDALPPGSGRNEPLMDARPGGDREGTARDGATIRLMRAMLVAQEMSR